MQDSRSTPNTSTPQYLKTSTPPNTMKYICLVYQEEEKLNAASDAEVDAAITACGEWVGDLEKNGRHIFSSGLQSPRTATTLRKKNGGIAVTDGPFAETKEFLGGFTIIEARDLNEAIQIASNFPAVQFGTVEVRPVMELDADLTDPMDLRIAESIRRTYQPAEMAK
ncbi:MAG: hypothetical protein QOJ65_293 [Fimbriimonadaceae bacterium]|nr:hypothetical protein [Fimbriimonadaceae bacterium]